jgi:hypothetical protein
VKPFRGGLEGEYEYEPNPEPASRNPSTTPAVEHFPAMGVCPPGFVSIHSLFANAHLGNCVITHATAHGTQFWLVEYPLPASSERKAHELSLGTIKNVRKTIQLTREK